MRVAIIGGSGLEERFSAPGLLRQPRRIAPSTPFGPPSEPIVLGALASSSAQGAPIEIALLGRHGAGHTIPPHHIPYRANIFALKSLGVTHIIATGAAGSLRNEIAPGSVVLIDQFIDRTTGAGTRGAERSFYDAVAVHAEFADPCCPVMRRWLCDAGARLCADPSSGAPSPTIHGHGTYVCIDGPTFSTRAESRMHQSLGADLVGMTALPEARLAREAEMAYALLALPTDYDCWNEHPTAPGETRQSLLEAIISNLKRSADAAMTLIEFALRDVAMLREHASPAHDALALAIWTRRSAIPESEIERLQPLWARHFAATPPRA